MMHRAYKIWRQLVAAGSVPPMAGVPIRWDHGNAEASRLGATQMVNGFGIAHLSIPPALNTLHTQRLAVDMQVAWSGNLTMRRANGETAVIDSLPRTGMNARLQQIGAGYGVVKYVGGASDKPHWSVNGH